MTNVGCRLFFLLLFVLPPGALADEASALLDRSRAIETEGMNLLAEEYRFEQSLLLPQSDRLTVFLTMPHGARVIMREITLFLDGKPVVTHPYSIDEVIKLQARAVQLLHVSRIPPGPHTMKIEVKVSSGKIVPMQPYAFTKESAAKFVEVQIAGSPVRDINLVEW